MTITLQIGKQSYSDYNFNEYDIIKLIVNKNFNLNINKSKGKYVIRFLYKNNNKFYNEQKKLKDNSQKTIDDCIIELDKTFDIVKNIIELTALEVSKMSQEELSYFGYIPSEEILYEQVDLPIDPYYLGFWLGDGTAVVPGQFTCGGEAKNGGCNDQEFILPFMKKLAESLNLEFKQVKDITFAINKGNEKKEQIMSTNKCFEEDWLEDTIKSCKALKISKNTPSVYDNFRKDRDPNKGEWGKLNEEEKKRWKKFPDKKDICKNSKYFKSGRILTAIYKIYEKGGLEELKKYREEKISNCDPLNYWFRKLNLIKNKHIPEIYLKASVQDRKKLIAGIIDSDGTSGGKTKNNLCWDIIQKKKIIIDGIEILAKSLGMFTRRSEKQCRAKKKDGSYSEYKTCYRISITPYHNWDVPVLLKRKKIITNPNEHPKSIYINIKNTNCDLQLEWTEELKIILYSVVDRFKKLTKSAPIPWIKLSEYDKRLKNINSQRLSYMYNELSLESDKYDKKIIKLDYDILIDEKFIKNYEKVKNIFENKKEFNNESHPYLYNWFNSWKFNKEYKDQTKKNMIIELDEIRKNNIILEFKILLTELEKHFIKEKTTPLESSSLGSKLKVIKNHYKKKEGAVWNNFEKRKLWEDLQKKYSDILCKNNRKITFILTDDRLDEKKFNTQNEVCKFLETDKKQIKKYRNSNKFFKGYLIRTN